MEYRVRPGPTEPSDGIDAVEKPQEVRAKDKYTVEIVLKQAQAAFLVQVSAIQPFVVVPKDSIPAGKSNLSAFPPGTGPFVTRIIRSPAS